MRLGISCKLIFAQGLALVFFILLAVISYYSIASYSSIHNKDIELANRMESVGDLQLLLERSLMPPNDYLISGNPGERDDYAAIVLEMAVLLERVAAPKNVPEEEARTVDELKKGIIDLEQSAMVLLSTENPVGNKEAASLMKELDARGRLLGRKAEKLHTRIRSDMAEHRRYATQIGERLIKLFYLVALVFLGGIIFLVFMVRKGVIAPIHSLKNAVNIIAQGNLDYNVDIRTGDEIEVLGEEFNKMARSLKVKKMESVEHLENLRRTNCLLDQNILRLHTLYNISKTLSSTLEAEKLFDQIVTEVQQSHSIQRISIMMVDNERGLIQIIAGVGFSNEAKKTTFKLQEGLYGWAAMSGEAMTINNPSLDSRFIPTEGLDDDASAVVIAPFRGREKVMGMICAYKLYGETFDRESFEMLTAISTQLALTLENARLFDETRLMAITDGMTSTYNYRHFMECLSEEFNRAKRYKRDLALVMLDVDHFKRFNDTFGHRKGDEVLKGVAGILKKSVRESDVVARYGGEEFVIILPETDKEKALMLAERLRKGVGSADFGTDESGPLERVTISLGVSAVDSDVKDVEVLIKNADIALYKAKDKGRDRVA